MKYNNLKITWKNGSYLETDIIYFDNWEMKEFISKYLNSFEWEEFGFFYLDDIKAEIEENKGDEDYTPPISLSEFEKHNATSLVYNSGEIFPEEVRWNDFREYILYLECLGIDTYQVSEFNSYEIEGTSKYTTVQLFDESYGDYNFINDVIDELKADGELEEELEKIQHDKSIRTNYECLQAVSTVLNRHGYTIKEI